jgi:hypothetical protein
LKILAGAVAGQPATIHANGRVPWQRKTHRQSLEIVAQPPNLPQELRSTQVLARFCVQMIIVVGFAAFGGAGFEKSLAALLWMSTVFGAVMGLMKREPPFGAVLNHWDEMVAYSALFALVNGLDRSALF